MKCAKCNADIEQDAQFCPYCGNAVNHGRQCVKCGEHLDDDSDFCPYCGTKQSDTTTELESEEMKEAPQLQEAKNSQNIVAEEPSIQETHTQNVDNDLVDTIPYENDNGSKKWIFIIVAVLLLGILGGGGYYFMSNKGNGSVETDSIAEIGDSVIADIHSAEGIKSRVNEIFAKGIHMFGEEAVNKFFSQEFRQLYSKVDEIDNTLNAGEIGFWNGSIWDGSQDDCPNGYEIVRVSTSSSSEAYIDVNLLSDYEERHREQKISLSLVFENGNWFIDDISDFHYKKEMKEYITYWQKKKEIIEGYTNILNDFAKKGKNSADGNFYFLHDITGDGYSELWVQVCNDDGLTCKLLIYEFKNGATSKIYQEEVGHRAHHSYCMKDDNVYLSYGHMGESSLSMFEYKNGKIQTREINEESGSEQSFGQDVEKHELTDRESLIYL